MASRAVYGATVTESNDGAGDVGWLRHTERMSPITGEPGVAELTRDEGRALVGEQAQSLLHMTLEEFERAYDAGELDPEAPGVLDVAPAAAVYPVEHSDGTGPSAPWLLKDPKGPELPLLDETEGAALVRGINGLSRTAGEIRPVLAARVTKAD